ncbi:MAG TPA: hypothetical protein VJN68_16495 [Burkholderiaceae bacterium]|nr:hypothetical protein [Burkholderiaceae bacterium]
MKAGKNAVLPRAVRLALMQGAFVAGAHAAFAAPPQLPSEGGLLVLPNVKVENAAKPIDGMASKTAATSGMKAYRDAETGKLRRPTADDLLAEAAATPAPAAAPSARITTGANGRRSAQLDESFMSYAVVSRNASGKLDLQCVTGEEQVRKALAGAIDRKEHAHAH